MLEAIIKCVLMSALGFVVLVCMCLAFIALDKLNSWIKDGDEGANTVLLYLVLVVLSYVIAGEATSEWLATTWVGAS